MEGLTDENESGLGREGAEVLRQWQICDIQDSRRRLWLGHEWGDLWTFVSASFEESPWGVLTVHVAAC